MIITDWQARHGLTAASYLICSPTGDTGDAVFGDPV